METDPNNCHSDEASGAMSGESTTPSDQSTAGPLYRYAYSGMFRFNAVGMCVLWLGVMVGFLVLWFNGDDNSTSGGRTWPWLILVSLFLTGVGWIHHIWSAYRTWLVVLTHDRVQIGAPKTGGSMLRREMLFDDIAKITRPSRPDRVVFEAKNGKKLKVPARPLSDADWDDFIARLREVVAGRFTIPEEW